MHLKTTIQITKQVYNKYMRNEKIIIGIDVYRSRYDACFYDIETKKCKYYTGSLKNNYGKKRLINRIKKDDLIIINEGLLAAELMIRFENHVIIVENEIVKLLINAKISRGKKLASFFIKNFRTRKNKKLSSAMIRNLLIEGEKSVSFQETLCDDGIKIFDSIEDGKIVNNEIIYDLDERTRNFNNHSDVNHSKVDEVEKVIEQFEKLNEIFDD